MNDNQSNLLEILEFQAKNNAHKIALIESLKDNKKNNELSYSTLSQQVKSLAYTISQQSTFGDHVIILMPNSIDYVIAFFACIYAGVIAVPAYPPHKKKRDWKRLNCIVDDCQPSIAVFQSSDSKRISLWLTEHDIDIKTLSVDQIDLNNVEKWEKPQIDVHDIAYLQYSSGSTGDPKGVMLSHENLISNTQLIIDTYEMTTNDRFINWLPLYHDMGFVGGILSPIRAGAHIRLLPSASVAQSPYVLFEAITKYRSTATAAPNFIFDIAVKRIDKEEIKKLNLSSLRLFVNGAEPINADTLKKFNQHFSSTGLSPNTIKPSYGMAEVCLLATSSQMNKPFNTLKIDPNKLLINKIILDDISGKEIASSGVLLPAVKVKIVDKDTRVLLPNGYVGEIMLKGDSITRGYWQKTELNAKTFNQMVGTEHGFMLTGDLGFIHTDNGNEHLYVTGRQKEILIINGCNYYPQDIEHSLLSLSENLMPHGAAVFEVNTDNYSKEIVLVQELTRKALKQKNYQDIISEIREVIAEEHELKLNTIVLLKPMTLAKTSSGKIQRMACRQAYLNEELESVTRWSLEKTVNNIPLALINKSANGIAQWIMNWVANRVSMPVTELSISMKLTKIGLDSIDAMTLSHELSKQLELTLPHEVSWTYPSIEELSNYLAEQITENKDNQPTINKTPTEGVI